MIKTFLNYFTSMFNPFVSKKETNSNSNYALNQEAQKTKIELAKEKRELKQAKRQYQNEKAKFHKKSVYKDYVV